MPVAATGPSTDVDVGLSDDAAAYRRRTGLANVVDETTSRSVADIVRANVFTRFNLIVGALLGVVLVVAPIQDALFGGVMIVNSLIGIVQEVRAKRTLDQLKLLNAPRARVVRAGRTREIPISDVVKDDVVEARAGDQIIVDGTVLRSTGLEVDESLLTGESDTVPKDVGNEVLSGSFAVAGVGRYLATRVGNDAYASRLAAEAKKFTLVSSDIRDGIDRILGIVRWLLVPAIGFLVVSQLRTDQSVRHAIAGAVAGSVAMIPQGLVLLTSVAFAVSVVRLARQQVLVQELHAVEGLARVDTVCFDKTGTLTTGELSLIGVDLLDGAENADEPLGAVAHADADPNATTRTIAAEHPDPGWVVTDSVPFSSARKWSAASFDDHGTWVIGAPEVVLSDDPEALLAAEGHAVVGQRVLALAHTSKALEGNELPEGLEVAALVRLGDTPRPDAAETLEYFQQQGVDAKVISGDHPQTVAAVAERVGMLGDTEAVDGRTLPEDPVELADVLEEHSVFGRVTPHQKRAMVGALQDRGHVVAMTGDGVNDVLALKDADIGVAMGSGSAASRSVAQLVLLDGRFSTLPSVVGEGRRVIANIERVANLFVVKTVYAFLLALAVGFAGMVFPFLPRHLTLVGGLTIGVPAFFLALEPSTRRYRKGFVKRVMTFALPVGAVAATATFAAYAVAVEETTSIVASRTIATLTLGSIGVLALVLVSRPMNPARRTIIGSVVVGFLVTISLPSARDFFALELPRPVVVLAAAGVVGMTTAAIYLTLRISGWLHDVSLEDLTALTSEAASRSQRAWASVVRRLPRADGEPPDDWPDAP